MTAIPLQEAPSVIIANGRAIRVVFTFYLTTVTLDLNYRSMICQKFHRMYITTLNLGVARCNPSSFEWIGYSESCCNITTLCEYQQGGCTSNNQCAGSLECGSNENMWCGESYSESQNCCRYQGGQIVVKCFSKLTY